MLGTMYMLFLPQTLNGQDEPYIESDNMGDGVEGSDLEDHWMSLWASCFRVRAETIEL